MENFTVSMNAILPLFIIMLVGFTMRKINMLNENTVETMNTAVFRVFLPALMFYNIYNTDLEESFDFKLLSFCFIALIGLFLVCCFIVPLIEKDKSKIGVLIQTIFRANYVIFGIPITVSLFGEEAAGTSAMLVAVLIPIYNILAVLTFEIFRKSKPNIGKIIKGIVKNNLILASITAIIFVLLNITLPYPVEKAIADISKLATPLAFILLGASFELGKSKELIRPISIGVLGRLVISPLIIIPIAIAYGFRDVELACILIAFGAPASVNCYTMAKQMGGDGELAGQLVVLTSALSTLSVFVWIFILKQLMYI